MKRMVQTLINFFFKIIREFQWIAIITCWIIALVIGYSGFQTHADYHNQDYSFLTLIYLTLQLITMESGSLEGWVNPLLNIARFTLPALVALTSFKALAILFRDQLQGLRLLRIRDHVIICGLSSKGLILAEQFKQARTRVVVIERDEEHPDIQYCRDKGIIVLIGDASQESVLLRAGISRASNLIAVTNDDGVNAEIAVTARKIVKNEPKAKLHCVLHITNPQICELFRERELNDRGGTGFTLSLFNVFETGARLMLSEVNFFENCSKGKPHLMVVGLGKFGENLVINAASNWTQQHPEKQMKFTIVDPEAEWKIQSLQIRFPFLSKVSDFVACPYLVQQPEFLAAKFLYSDTGKSDIDRIFICLDDDSLSLYSALALQQHVKKSRTPIHLRMLEDTGLGRLLEPEAGVDAYDNLIPFGLLNRTCRPEQVLGGIIERLAFAIHDEYLRSQIEAGESSQTNPNLIDWNDLPDYLKESNREQARDVCNKLESINFEIIQWIYPEAGKNMLTEQEIEDLAWQEHERWKAAKIADKWVFAPGKKNEKKKTHPCLVSWDELAEVDKEKNRVMICNIPEFLQRVGFQIQRLS